MEQDEQFKADLPLVWKRLELTRYHDWMLESYRQMEFYGMQGYVDFNRRHKASYKTMRICMYKCRDALMSCGAYKAYDSLPNARYSDIANVALELSYRHTEVYNYVDIEHVRYLPAYTLYLKMAAFRTVHVKVLKGLTFKDTRLYRAMGSIGANMTGYEDECYYGDPVRILLEARLRSYAISRLPIELIRMVDTFLT